jgi:molybdopterin synthase sulfur carrier subunit
VTASVQVRYFASLREAFGASETLTLAGEATVGSVRDALIARSPRHAELLARGRAVRTALNQTLCDESAQVGDGAELAFFPPVTGG